MLKWILSIAAAVIAGIIVWWFTEGMHNSNEKKELKREVVNVIDSTKSMLIKDSIVQHNPSVDDALSFKQDTITKPKTQKDTTKKSSTPKSRNISEKELSLINGEAYWNREGIFHINLYNGLNNKEISEATIKIIYDKEVKGSREEIKNGNESIERLFREELENPIPPLSARTLSINVPGRKSSFYSDLSYEYRKKFEKDNNLSTLETPIVKYNDFTWNIHSAKGMHYPL